MILNYSFNLFSKKSSIIYKENVFEINMQKLKSNTELWKQISFCEVFHNELYDFTFPKETVNSKNFYIQFLRSTLNFQLWSILVKSYLKVKNNKDNYSRLMQGNF